MYSDVNTRVGTPHMKTRGDIAHLTYGYLARCSGGDTAHFKSSFPKGGWVGGWLGGGVAGWLGGPDAFYSPLRL